MDWAKAITRTARVLVCLVGFGPLPVPAQIIPPASPTLQSAQSPTVAPTPSVQPAVPPAARAMAYVNLERSLSKTAVGLASSARVNEARAKGRGSEVAAEEQQRLQSLMQPLTRTIRVRYGLGMVLSMNRSGLIWTDETLDLTDELISMLDEAQPSAERREVQPIERIGILNLGRVAEQSKLGKLLHGKIEAKPAVEFQRRVGPVLSEFGREASLRLLFSAADSGIVWSDPRLDVTSAVVERLDKATDRNAPVPMPWSEPPPAVLSYVRLRVLGERAGLARELTATVDRLSEKVASGRASIGERKALADAQARLKKDILAEVAAVAEEECRARGITLLLSMGDSGILDADGAIDLTETLLKALGQR